MELLVRVLERSEQGPLKRAAQKNSFLLVQMSLEVMQETFPLLKAAWIESGDSQAFLQKLKNLSDGIWNLNFKRYEGIKFLSVFE